MPVAREGPLARDMRDMQSLLTDPARCATAIVSLPEEMPVNEAIELDRALKAHGLPRGPMFLNERRPLVDLAAKNRLPVVYSQREFVDAGGLLAYGVNIADLFRRAATYVDKILKGAKPGDLPVEQPTKFELVINLKTAKALGLTIPPSLLQRADEVIQ